MNEIVNNFLSAGDKFTPEMHFRQLGFTYCTCGPFTKNKERIQKFKEQEIHDNFYHNELDKPCFKHNMAYGDFKELTKRTVRARILGNTVFNIAKKFEI